MSKQRTIKDWPIGTKGRTTKGNTYEVVYYHPDRQAILVVVSRSEENEVQVFWQPIKNNKYLIHPNDEKISILDDLSNPDMIALGDLDEESLVAIYNVGWKNLDYWHTEFGVWNPFNYDMKDIVTDPDLLICRVRPEPKMRQMTQVEAKAWAERQPESVLISRTSTIYAALYWEFDLPRDQYYWVDVDKGGGWKPLPMVEEQ